uniref:GST N-terminal domain-containing protein n=1 Tax=Oreochromis aureus TaxID=47969 RepID=A0AAZ1XLX1_OREAU
CHGKVVQHSFNGRGSMESIRWLLTVAEVQVTCFTHCCVYSADGALMFQHAPMLEIDGMKLVQIKNLKDRVVYRISDIISWLYLNTFLCFSLGSTCTLSLPFCADPKPKLDNIQSRAKERYLPVTVYLVGGKLSLADAAVLCVSSQSFQGRMIRIPAINRFLQPGSKRKPPPDENYAKAVMEVFQIQITISVKSVTFLLCSLSCSMFGISYICRPMCR